MQRTSSVGTQLLARIARTVSRTRHILLSEWSPRGDPSPVSRFSSCVCCSWLPSTDRARKVLCFKTRWATA